MSSVASFVLLSKSCIPQLRDAAVPLRTNLKVQDNYWAFLETNGTEVTTYQWSGHALGTLFPYLDQYSNLHFDDPEFDELESFLCSVRGATILLLTDKDKQARLAELDPQAYDEHELRSFFEEFNQTEFEDAGKAMLDGVAALRDSLLKVNKDSIVLLNIG